MCEPPSGVDGTGVNILGPEFALPTDPNPFYPIHGAFGTCTIHRFPDGQYQRALARNGLGVVVSVVWVSEVCVVMEVR